VEPAPGAGPLEERAQHAERQEGRAVLVDDGGADGRRRLVGAPRDRGEAGDGLDQEVLAGPRAVGARLAVARGGDIDEPGVDGRHALPVEAEARHHARAEVLDEDVGALDQAPGDRLALGALEIEREAPLVAVRGEEEDAHAVLVEVASGPVALPEPAARRLDLDHVGAEVGEELDAGRPEEELGEAEDAGAGQDGERSGHARSGRYSTIFRMWVAAATTSCRWFVQVARERILPAAGSCSAISYVTVTVSPMKTGFGKRIRS